MQKDKNAIQSKIGGGISSTEIEYFVVKKIQRHSKNN